MIFLGYMMDFLKTHWAGAGIATLALGIMATISLQHADIHHLHNALDLCHTEAITLEHSNQTLMASLQNQNAALLALQQESAAKTRAASQALMQAQTQARARLQRTDALLARAAPGNECADMRMLIDNYAREVKP